VSAKDCTLCLSCVGACPGGALQDGYDKPELRFIEANCLQCGMCTRVCPEDAIWITPRFLFDAEARRRPRVLHHEAPFECVSCSKPFATRSVIERMVGRLGGHYMFRDERAKRRLMMCEDCRVADIAQDPEAMATGVRVHGHQ
jgi:ferredoxin